MPPRTCALALRMRFFYPPATRPISTTPHLFGGGPRPGKSRPRKPRKGNYDDKEGAIKRPHRSDVLSATAFQPRQSLQRNRKLPKLGPERAVIPKSMTTAPSRDRIHYIPPSNPVRERLGPGMYYNAKVSPSRRSSTPLDKDVETEYLYTLMLRKTFSIPILPAKSVPLKYAIKRCMDATGSHQKATSTRLRKGFLSEAVGTKKTKNRAWVCDKARATSFDWDLHENMRFIHGHMFTGREVDYSTPEGQVFGAQALVRPNFEEQRGKRFREAMETLKGRGAVTATPGAATYTATPTSKIAGMEIASDYDSDDSDYGSDDSDSDDWFLEGSGSDTDFEALMTGEEGGEETGSESESETESEDEDEDRMGNDGRRERTSR